MCDDDDDEAFTNENDLQWSSYQLPQYFISALDHLQQKSPTFKVLRNHLVKMSILIL